MPDDFEFYAKIKVPAPTFCPECRTQRRLAFRNERTLYKRKCDLCGKDMISMYPQNTSFPVYCLPCFNSDKWDSLEYGADFKRDVPFLTQFKELTNKVPRPQNVSYRLVNSDYTNCVGDLKNCYLIFGSQNDEDCYYSHYINKSKDCMDILYCLESEKCYECFDIEKCYNLAHSASCAQCSDSMLLYDCRNVQDSLGCAGLRNKSYHILNQSYSKEEYLKKKAELKLDTRDGIQNFYNKFLNEVYLKIPRKFYHGRMNKDFSGDYVSNSEKTFNAFYTKNARNTKFSFWNINSQDVYDYFAWGDAELCYETTSVGEKAYNCRFCANCWDSPRNLEYSDLCFNSSDLFGCVAMRHKQYCILNKEYSESEFKKLREEIISQMNLLPYYDAKGRVYKYGEFFPVEMSPFNYNDTVAQEHFPLGAKALTEAGYKFSEPEDKNYKPTISYKDLPQSVKETPDTIISEIISCEAYEENSEEAKKHNCATAFKIIPAELEFYKNHNLPLPTKCPNSRHFARANLRNPLKLWQRKCSCNLTMSDVVRYQNIAEHFHGKNPCPNEFETSYSPDGKEIVYCEACYNSEVV